MVAVINVRSNERSLNQFGCFHGAVNFVIVPRAQYRCRKLYLSEQKTFTSTGAFESNEIFISGSILPFHHSVI